VIAAATFPCPVCDSTVHAVAEVPVTCATCATVAAIEVRVRTVTVTRAAKRIARERHLDARLRRDRSAPGASLVDAVTAAGGARA
jgi:hypothetical protein